MVLYCPGVMFSKPGGGTSQFTDGLPCKDSACDQLRKRKEPASTVLRTPRLAARAHFLFLLHILGHLALRPLQLAVADPVALALPLPLALAVTLTWAFTLSTTTLSAVAVTLSAVTLSTATLSAVTLSVAVAVARSVTVARSVSITLTVAVTIPAVFLVTLTLAVSVATGLLDVAAAFPAVIFLRTSLPPAG